MNPLYVALLHHPVLDRNKAVITSSVTNMDLHDIARSCRTFGVRRYFVVHPSPDEQALNRRILSHWASGYGERSHPTRKDALSFVELVTSFDQVLQAISEECGQKPFCVGTSARREGPKHIGEGELLESLKERPALLVFGTGYGLTSQWHSTLEAYLAGIEGEGSDFNHLSVRSAVAIYLDRLFGRRRRDFEGANTLTKAS